MSLFHGHNLPSTSSLIHLTDAANSKHTTGSGVIKDATNNINWNRYTTVDVVEEGLPAFALTNSTDYLQTPNSILFAQYYTCFYLWKPLVNATSWKTLHRNVSDHVAIISSGDKTSLGMYSNRNGAFRDCGYDITNDVWQTLILTGTGDSIDNPIGTTEFYVNGESVGSSDRVACGTNLYRLGWSGQPPGHIAITGVYNRKLLIEEIKTLHFMLASRL